MKVSQAVSRRASTRAFLDKAVSNELIREILQKASRSPSGGNLQPWRVFVINNKSMNEFLNFQENWHEADTPEYDIYPPKLKEPYRTNRYELGEEMYRLLGIAKDDKEARLNWVMNNFNFFGAPAGLFCYVDKIMGPPQWSDLGMFLQTFMLLAVESGLDTCPQEAWSLRSACVSNFLNVPDNLMLFCGMAIGFKDEHAQVNNLVSQRNHIDEWATFI